ncbi:MAG: UvrB/UvrC motif-containing protein [Spirochaetales bacterium]|nr:UvrB/UvrC motif-containing protein [Spirochaetales bacterium]
MLCELCGKREALVHIHQAIGNETIDIHLCETCAHEKGISRRSDKVDLSLTQLLTGLLDLKRGEGTEEATECPTCGMSVADFKKDGRLGCPDCYTSFASQIRSIHKRLSGMMWHRGKLPQKLVTYKELLVDRERLKTRLDDAVSREDYEAAAVIRDQIRSLEKGGDS